MPVPSASDLMPVALIAAAVTAVSGYGALALYRAQGSMTPVGRVLTWVVIVALSLLAFAGMACSGLATLVMFG